MVQANKTNIIANLFQTIAYESLTISNSSKTLTSGIYTPSDGDVGKKALITLESANIRYRTDGTAPTSSEGHLLTVGSVLLIIGTNDIKNFKAIRSGSSDGTIRVSYGV